MAATASTDPSRAGSRPGSRPGWQLPLITTAGPDPQSRRQVTALRAGRPAAEPDLAWAGRIKYMIHSRVGAGPVRLGPAESLLDPATGLPKRA